MSWTDARISVLEKMWKDGSSAADIAKELGEGVTRNAVIGKAHRMGLSGRPSPIKKKKATGAKTTKKATTKKAATKKTTKKAVAKKPAKKIVAKMASKKTKALAPRKIKKSLAATQEEIELLRLDADTIPEDGGVSLLDLTERMCKWPFGDPQEDNFTFCGCERYLNKPYCQDHVLIAYQASSKARAAAKARDAAAQEEDAVDEDEEDELANVDNAEVDEDNVGKVD